MIPLGEIEAAAQALFDRMVQRCAARGVEPHHRAGTLVKHMPPSYRDDYEADAEAALVAAQIARAAEHRRNCQHPRRVGTGMISSDGSSSGRWNCPDCGASDSWDRGPTAARPSGTEG